ncbi:MAG TPA: metal-sensitive transcriptional regulator [Dehalococcoidia bacterium]
MVRGKVDPTADVMTRLRRIEGQVRGIQRMLEENRICEDVLTQLTAVRAGLDQATLALLDAHVERCVLGGAPADPLQLQQIQRAMRLIARYDTSPLPAARADD